MATRTLTLATAEERTMTTPAGVVQGACVHSLRLPSAIAQKPLSEGFGDAWYQVNPPKGSP